MLHCCEYQTMCLSITLNSAAAACTHIQSHKRTHTASGDRHRPEKMLRLQLAGHLLCCQDDAEADHNPMTHLRRPLYSSVEISPLNRIYCGYELTMGTSSRP